MIGRSAALAAFVVATTIGAAARAAASDPPGVEVRLSWVRDEASTDCPDARVIEERTRSWLGRDPFSGSAATAVEVMVTRRAESYVARIRIRDQDGAVVGERVLTSEEPRCDTLASAVAFALAVQVDPEAAIRPKRAAPIAPLAPPVPKPVERPEPVTPPPAPSTTSIEASVSAGAVITSGLLPGGAPGARLAAGLGWRRGFQLVVSGLVLPESRTADRTFGFGLTALGAGACVDLLRSALLELAPCAELHGGELHALVYVLEPAPPGSRFWAGASATARLKLRTLAPFTVELGAGVVVPFTRPRFEVEGRAGTVFQQAVVAPVADLAVGVSFP